MATRNYAWTTSPTGTEGTTTVYVDSDFGSDAFGDGTRQKPYSTLGKGYTAKSTKPTLIICRGLFSESMSEGNHTCTIKGDYWGAATFDGNNRYIIYGFTHVNMVIKNVPAGTEATQVFTGSPSLAGVGRATYAYNVGPASLVAGVAGSSVCLHKSALYFGYIGGNTAVEKVVYNRPTHNSDYPLLLAGYQNSRILYNCTVYGVENIADRGKAQYGNLVSSTVFGKFAMVANEKVKRTFVKCLFTSDVSWWWLTNDRGDAGTPEEIILTGDTSEEKQQSLLDALTEKGLASNLMPVFENCIFSDQTSDEIFNDAENGDFTLKPGCDADLQQEDGTYIGALPPAIHIPVMTDSTGEKETWDERSASGCVTITDIDGIPCIALDTASSSEVGEVYSKIITIDPTKVQLDSVWADIESRVLSYGTKMWKENILGNEYSAGDTLPVGHYVVKGDTSVTYGDALIPPGDTIFVTEADTTFSLDDVTKDSTLVEVIDPSMMDVVYCRCRSVTYARVGTNDDLQQGATYLNDGAEPIVYHGRTIVRGESFVCMWDTEKFTCPSNPEQTIAIVFDDTRVPEAEWIPAATMGAYFVGKSGGAIVNDNYGIPYSSGNARAYSQTLAKSTMDRRYVQFCIKVRRYGTGKVGE